MEHFTHQTFHRIPALYRKSCSKQERPVQCVDLRTKKDIKNADRCHSFTEVSFIRASEARVQDSIRGCEYCTEEG